MSGFSRKQNEMVQRVLGGLQANSRRRDALLSCQQLGITTQAHAALVGGVGYREMDTPLGWLLHPGADIQPLVQQLSLNLEGQNGRPPKAYLLTEFGATVLSQLDPEKPVHAPNLRDMADLHHRFCQLQLLTQARQAGMNAEVEYVLTYPGGSLRADLALNPEGSNPLFLEVEAGLARSHLHRAEEKLEREQMLALSENAPQPLRVVLVFNLRERDAQDTISKWCEARARCEAAQGRLRYDLRFVLIGQLDGNLAEALGNAPTLEPLVVETAPEPPPAAAVSNAPELPPAWVQPHLRGYLEQLRAFWAATHPQHRFNEFFQLMRAIYGASYYPDSATTLYAAHPRESLWLLKHYLNLPANKPLLDELKESLGWVQKRSSQLGLIMFRDVMSRVIWDVFMRHHGFSRGGALGIIFQIPEFQDIRSDYWVEVRLMNSRGLVISEWRFNEMRDGLGWVLSSLFIYSEELGLGKRLWRQADTKRQGKHEK